MYSWVRTYIGHLLSYCRPASSETEEIVKLFDAGMSCARVNLSHGSEKVKIIFELLTLE
jgi:pyruvate kinase